MRRNFFDLTRTTEHSLDAATLRESEKRMESCDRPAPGLPASAVAIQGSNVTITITGVGGTYEG